MKKLAQETEQIKERSNVCIVFAKQIRIFYLPNLANNQQLAYGKFCSGLDVALTCKIVENMSYILHSSKACRIILKETHDDWGYFLSAQYFVYIKL